MGFGGFHGRQRRTIEREVNDLMAAFFPQEQKATA
jgi:hypothetical protein